MIINENSSQSITKEQLIEIADSFSRISHGLVLLWDYQIDKCIYISTKNDMSLGSITNSLIDVYGNINHAFFPADEAIFLNNLYNSCKSLIEIDRDRDRVAIFANHHILLERKKIAVLSKITHLAHTKNSFPNILLILSHYSIHKNNTFGLLHNLDNDLWYKLAIESKRWESIAKISLTSDERRMLLLSRAGYSAKDISIIMCKSVDTINYYRKSIYEKLSVKNISVAISTAIDYGII